MDKPKIKHVTFYRTEGRYNLFNPSERSARYAFTIPHLSVEQIKEMELKTFYLIDLDKDYNFDPDSYTALEVAYELKDIIESYWINTDKEKIKKLIEYLESIEEQQGELRHWYKIENAKYQINYWEEELKALQA